MNVSHLKDSIENLEDLSPENLKKLVEETVATFQEIQTKITSSSKDDRTEALEVAKELKLAMEAQLQNLQSQLGLSAEQIEEYLANPDHFSANELKSLDESKEELSQFQK